MLDTQISGNKKEKITIQKEVLPLHARAEVLILSSIHLLVAGVTLFLILQGVRSDWRWGMVDSYLIWFGQGGIFYIIGLNLPAFFGVQLCLTVLYFLPRMEARVVLAGVALLNAAFHAPFALIPYKLWGVDLLVAFVVPLVELLWLWRSRTAKCYFSKSLGLKDKIFRK
jgi:hypothetical protein